MSYYTSLINLVNYIVIECLVRKYKKLFIQNNEFEVDLIWNWEIILKNGFYKIFLHQSKCFKFFIKQTQFGFDGFENKSNPMDGQKLKWAEDILIALYLDYIFKE